jgi:predicted protein tyrosine phosphatase
MARAPAADSSGAQSTPAARRASEGVSVAEPPSKPAADSSGAQSTPAARRASDGVSVPEPPSKPAADSSGAQSTPAARGASEDISVPEPPSDIADTISKNDRSVTPTIPTLFRVYCHTEFGDAVVAAGSHDKLGNWEPAKALRLRHQCQVDTPFRDCWEGEVDLVPETSFEFKFVRLIGGDPQRALWETGPNRRAVIQRNSKDGCLIEVEWERTRVLFSIYYPTKEKQHLCVTGDLPEIGRWVEPGPVPMALSTTEERLETGGKGRRWSLTVSVPSTVGKFAYRYVLVDDNRQQTIWEREPNRYATLERAVNGRLECFDANFVASLEFDEICPDIYIGPYPQTPEHVEMMHEAGITAVLNLQTDEDFAHHSIPWSTLMETYTALEMQVIRCPIPDFNAEALMQLLPDAVRALDAALKAKRVVYVHCTAGMGRAPAVVVAYLVWRRGMTLEDALSHVKARRAVAAPNVTVLEKVLRNPL